MIYLSVAESKDGSTRVYLNYGDDLYCSESLVEGQVPIFVNLCVEAITSFSDPMASSRWEKAEKDSFPATHRKAIGMNGALNEMYVCKYDKRGIKSQEQMIETGLRHIVMSTYMLAVSKLFLIDLPALLAEQKAGI